MDCRTKEILRETAFLPLLGLLAPPGCFGSSRVFLASTGSEVRVSSAGLDFFFFDLWVFALCFARCGVDGRMGQMRGCVCVCVCVCMYMKQRPD